ncbi:MAG: ATP-binding protein, partial [Erythrobacter sp.]|nr:ATP-binding protein [Erythrobacter sp.]
MALDLLNVFTPALAIGDPAKFAGRRDQLNAVSIALQSAGTQIVIYGNRGVGKSSLALQLQSLAIGDTEVIDKLDFKPAETPDFLVIRFECDDTVLDVRGLIIRLLTDDDGLGPWIPFKVETIKSSTESGLGLNVKVLNVQGKLSKDDVLVKEAVEQDVFATFNNAVSHILSSGVVKGILFIIDEVDRIRDRSELASFVRARSSNPSIKFALVGVATTPNELISSHESIVRQISDGCVEMPPMTREELGAIFQNVEDDLKGEGFEFTHDAKEWIIDIAKGHPYYVHLLGKHCIIRAASTREHSVTSEMAQDVLVEIANKGTAKVQESVYAKAIGQSYVREYILKILAQQETEEINTSVVYPLIASSRGMDTNAISVYMGHLVSDKFGGVLEKTRERRYRFKDSLFKA